MDPTEDASTLGFGFTPIQDTLIPATARPRPRQRRCMKLKKGGHKAIQGFPSFTPTLVPQFCMWENQAQSVETSQISEKRNSINLHARECLHLETKGEATVLLVTGPMLYGSRGSCRNLVRDLTKFWGTVCLLHYLRTVGPGDFD